MAGEPNREIDALRIRLEDRRRDLDELRAAQDDEDHLARRLGDVMERHGGRQIEAETRLSMLDEGRRLTAKARAQAEREIADFERRLRALEEAP